MTETLTRVVHGINVMTQKNITRNNLDLCGNNFVLRVFSKFFQVTSTFVVILMSLHKNAFFLAVFT